MPRGTLVRLHCLGNSSKIDISTTEMAFTGDTYSHTAQNLCNLEGKRKMVLSNAAEPFRLETPTDLIKKLFCRKE